MRKADRKPAVKDPRVDNAYSIMQSMENRLGGGEGVQGIYGSITQSGMQRVLDSMRYNCGLDHNSVLVDVGAGLGRPLLHALVNPGVKSAFGIELDEVKVAKAKAFIEQTLAELAKRGHVKSDMLRPEINCTSIEQVPSFGTATHAYSFWEGIPIEGRKAFGQLFASSKIMKCVAVVQRAIRNQHPTQLMQSYGFGPLLLIANFPVSMSGSGASFQAYILSKIPEASVMFLSSAVKAAKPLLEKQVALEEADAVPTKCRNQDQGSQQQAQGAVLVGQDEQRIPHVANATPPTKLKTRQQTITSFGKDVKEVQTGVVKQSLKKVPISSISEDATTANNTTQAQPRRSTRLRVVQ